jgi:uncharacterized protein
VIDPDLRRLLVCPVDRADLVDDVEASRLECSLCHRRYPVEDGIPVLLVERAEQAPA